MVCTGLVRGGQRGTKYAGLVTGLEGPRSYKTFYKPYTREEMLEKLRLRYVKTFFFFRHTKKNLEKLRPRDVKTSFFEENYILVPGGG